MIMNTSKAIDISKSSLISLKAELSRKQDEVQKAKANKSTSDRTHHLSKSKKNIFEKRKHKKEETGDDLEQDVSELPDVDNEALTKSREVLEMKSKLYTHLQEGVLTTDRGKSEYLVNFDQKTIDKQKEDNSVSKQVGVEETEAGLSDLDADSEGDEDDWVDFTDALGRSRRCLRKDLVYMKQKNEELVKQLKPPSPPTQLPTEKDSSSVSVSEELLSSDMHREMMRRKWEEQEQRLLNKTDVHYQDLLFDEARTHGVGYYSFSTDEDERAKQQRELLRLRQDTLKRQEEAQGLRERRNQQLQARLKAARMRNRQRLGLPPDVEEKSEDQSDVIITGETEDKDRKEEMTNEKRLEELEKSLKRAAHVRPWDAGKDGVKIQPIMSQEEWVEQKREERVAEFAPPSNITEDSLSEINTSLKRGQPGLFFTSKKLRTSSNEPTRSTAGKHITKEKFTKIKNELSDDYPEETNKESFVNNEKDCRKRAEIPPPLTMEYYGGTSHKFTKEKNKKTSSKDIEDSISEGLKYLQKQNEKKEKKSEKGLLDII